MWPFPRRLFGKFRLKQPLVCRVAQTGDRISSPARLERGAEAKIQHLGPVWSSSGENRHPVQLVQRRGGLRYPVWQPSVHRGGARRHARLHRLLRHHHPPLHVLHPGETEPRYPRFYFIPISQFTRSLCALRWRFLPTGRIPTVTRPSSSSTSTPASLWAVLGGWLSFWTGLAKRSCAKATTQCGWGSLRMYRVFFFFFFNRWCR